MTDFEYQIFVLTNEIRQRHNLAILVWSGVLANVARAHSLDLATNNIFSHTGSNGSAPEQRLHRAHTTIRFAGENISGGRSNPAEAINDWMSSAGHRAVILNVNAVYLGVGAAYAPTSRFKLYVTQVFGASYS